MKIHDVRKKLPKHPSKKYKRRPLKKIKRIVVHCDDLGATVWDVARYDIKPNHLSKTGAPGITYHYFIHKDGNVFYCQDEKVVTWHVANFNSTSVGVCLSYKATGNDNPPTPEQDESLIYLLAKLCLSLGIQPTHVVGHRELPGTGYVIRNGKKVLRKTCPGLAIDLAVVRFLVAIKIQTILKVFGLYDAEVDGIWGPKSFKAFSDFIKYKKSFTGWRKLLS